MLVHDTNNSDDPSVSEHQANVQTFQYVRRSGDDSYGNLDGSAGRHMKLHDIMNKEYGTASTQML
jgi:hypothetical protein